MDHGFLILQVRLDSDKVTVMLRHFLQIMLGDAQAFEFDFVKLNDSWYARMRRLARKAFQPFLQFFFDCLRGFTCGDITVLLFNKNICRASNVYMWFSWSQCKIIIIFSKLAYHIHKSLDRTENTFSAVCFNVS